MTVTPDSGAAPWDGAQREPYPTLEPRLPPVEPVRPPRSRLRWLLASGAALLVLVAVAVVFVLANPPTSAGVSRLVSYAPASAVAYIELRLDLPGDQRQHLLDLLGRFPGLDEAGVEEKVNQLLGELDQQGIDFQRDIEPWFDGQLAFVLYEIDISDPNPSEPAYAAVFALKDRAAFQAFIERQGLFDMLEPAADHAGASVWTGALEGERVAFGLNDDAVIFAGREADLHAALEANAGTRAGLAADTRFESATGNLRRDHLGLVYVNLTSFAEAIESALEGEDLPFNLGGQLGMLPGVIVVELRAEANHLLLESRSLPRPGSSLPPMAPNRSTALAGYFPADTQAYAEVRDLGAGIKQAIEQLSEVYGDDVGDELGMPIDLEQLLGTPLEDYLDFLGDTAIGFSFDGTRLSGGLVGQLNDEQAASQRLARLVSSLRAMLAFAGDDIPLTIGDETRGGVTVTVFRPRGVATDELGFSSFSYAVADGRLLMGFDDFVSQAIDGGPASTLAASPRYSRAVTAAGAENGGLLFVDLGGLRGVLESVMPDEASQDYAEIRPYLEPFGQLVITYSTVGESQVQRMLLLAEE